MGGELDTHELPDYNWSIGTGPGSIPDVAKDLVAEKYALSKDYADLYSGYAQQFLTDVANHIKGLAAIDTAIDIPALELSIPVDLNSLLRAIPENPITDADYDIDVPDELLWNYSEDPYVSSLLDSLKARLRNIIENGGGALASVEDDIFDRETERDALVNEDAKTKIADNWAKRGWSMPGNALMNSMMQVDTEYQNKRLDKSRAIAEESRKVEIAMEQNAFAESNKLEATTMDHHDKVQERKLKTAQAVIQYGLAVVDVALKKLQTKASTYAEVVKAYVAQTDAIRSVISVHVAVLDAQIKYITATIQARTAELDAKIKKLQVDAGLGIEAMKSNAQISAQIAASALAAFHASAAVSGQFQSALSQNQSLNESWQHYEDVSPTSE